MDNLFYTLKELQKEKNCLEQKLHVQKLNRHTLEQELEKASEKYSRMQEKHFKLAETLAVAQQKVNQTQGLSVGLQDEINRYRPKLEHLQLSIENEKQLQQKLMENFETSLDEIAGQLFEAKRFYNKATLTSEINKAELEQGELETKDADGHKRIHILKQNLNKIQLEKESQQLSHYGVEETLNLCLRALERDRINMVSFLEKVKADQREMHNILCNAQLSDHEK
ncbi:uncharacterized protein LOC131943445 [Physella acuta]|uniref:uncharacterized protein LOC131943445 n=1 Tax=Physella acuta TaxID=109671 RepID=UPI0027DBD04D|nr:uncharacterized protein LOC131943445 [Physella acuta]